jgi:hypothetical protein
VPAYKFCFPCQQTQFLSCTPKSRNKNFSYRNLSTLFKERTMNPVLFSLLPAIRQGYCCSQLLLLLALQARDETNPALLRGMRGLCHGIGQSGGPCGLLTGGAVALAYLAGKDDQDPHPLLEAMENDYALWFYERTRAYGGFGCEQVALGLGAASGAATGAARELDQSLCGNFLAECWEKILQILESYSVDIAG